MFRLAARQLSLSSTAARRAPSSWLFHTKATRSSIQTTFLLPDPTSHDGCSTPEGRYKAKLTKIVATIGPTSEQFEPLQSIVKSGMRIMRLNFSHATKEEVELRMGNLKKCQGRHSRLPHEAGDEAHEYSNLRAVLLDTKGPEIRTGKLENDHSGKEVVKLEQGNSITLHTTAQVKEGGSTATDLYIDYTNLHKCLKPGMKVLLDDGAITLTVAEVENQKEFHGTVTCSIDNTGELRSRAGVNLPGAETDLPAMSEKDKLDILYGMKQDIDVIAASFIQTAQGVDEVRRHTQTCAKELGWEPNAPLPLIISKIESMSALKNFDAILEASDGIMVARGDLGVEIPIQQVTNAQKEMIAACNALGKPVIVATQMLESMGKNPRPTRAEVADVCNSVYDGADCVMLSGETAKGKYPVESVKMMNEIIESAEGYALSGGIGVAAPNRFVGRNGSAEEAVAKAAVAATESKRAKAILILSHHGSLPQLISAYRPNVPIVTFCASAKLGRQLQIYRGVHPVVGMGGVSWSKRHERAVQNAKAMGFVESGDEVVVVTTRDTDTMGKASAMMLISVP